MGRINIMHIDELLKGKVHTFPVDCKTNLPIILLQQSYMYVYGVLVTTIPTNSLQFSTYIIL